MTYVTRLPRAQVVALRKESVDRNLVALKGCQVQAWSLSARRAWIEIGLFGVDTVSRQRRSPQGERG